MNLRKDGREWYALEIETSPPVAAWEASFDNGATWLASTTVGTDGWSRWLVAGPNVDPTGATVLSANCKPVVRAIDNPEIIPRLGPGIYLT